MFFYSKDAIPTAKTNPEYVILAKIDLQKHVTESTKVPKTIRKMVTEQTNFDWMLQNQQILTGYYRINKSLVSETTKC